MRALPRQGRAGNKRARFHRRAREEGKEGKRRDKEGPMRPNKDGLCSSEGQMGVLFMGSPYTLRETPSGHLKAEAVRNVFALAGDNCRSPNISTSSRAATASGAARQTPRHFLCAPSLLGRASLTAVTQRREASQPFPDERPPRRVSMRDLAASTGGGGKKKRGIKMSRGQTCLMVIAIFPDVLLPIFHNV